MCICISMLSVSYKVVECSFTVWFFRVILVHAHSWVCDHYAPRYFLLLIIKSVFFLIIRPKISRVTPTTGRMYYSLTHCYKTWNMSGCWICTWASYGLPTNRGQKSDNWKLVLVNFAGMHPNGTYTRMSSGLLLTILA